MSSRRVFMYQVTQMENLSLDELTELLNETKIVLNHLMEEYKKAPEPSAVTIGEDPNTRIVLLREISRAISRKYQVIQARTVLLKRIRQQRSRQKRFAKVVTPEQRQSKRKVKQECISS